MWCFTTIAAEEPRVGDIADAISGRPLRVSEATGAPVSVPGREATQPTRDAAFAAKPSGDAFDIPDSQEPGWEARAVHVLEQGPIAEAYRRLALGVTNEMARRGGSSVVVTSTVPREGKTVTACNLALALGSLQGDQRIALVDLDLRAPRVGRAFDLSTDAGIEQVLRGRCSLDAVRIETRSSIDIFPVRGPVREAHKLLASGALSGMLEDLEAHYAYIVCDAPPVLPVPDVEILLRHVPWFIAVVRSGKTARSAFVELSRRLPSSKFLGTFLNDARPQRHERYYRTHYYEGAANDGQADAPEAGG
jgi:Mrp family chromosome partitioning ATPase